MNIQTSTLGIGTFVRQRVEPILPTFPVAAKSGADMPFCTYRRSGVIPSSTKDGVFDDSVGLVLTVVTAQYLEGLEKAEEVRARLDGIRTVVGGVPIEIHLTDASEDYNANFDVYAQLLTFRIDYL